MVHQTSPTPNHTNLIVTELSHHQIVLGPYQLADLTPEAFISHIIALVGQQRNKRPTVVFSLHVGGLNLRHDKNFTDDLARADVLVADGISVAALARLAGARGLYRHPTTDRGWQLLAGLTKQLNRPVRVALIGGPPGLTERAGAVMASQSSTQVVLTEHGYHHDWQPVLARLNAAKCDVVIVGMGMPIEAHWVVKHLSSLPNGLVLTCGGWFGHIVGEEKRAPAWMRKMGVEWIARLIQQPRRLWKRYTAGLWSTLAMIPTALACRRGNRHSSQ